MYSLRRRLLISASLLLLFFLGIMALGLNNAFKQSVLSNAEDALRNQILLLISNIDVIDGQVVAPAVFSEPRLAQTDADLYAQIYSKEHGVIWRSPSLLDQQLPHMDHKLGGFDFFDTVEWPDKPKIYSMTLEIEWETEQEDIPFVIQVAEHSKSYTDRLRNYQRSFGIWLISFAAVLLILLLLLLGWSLKPLNRVTRQVADIEKGVRQRFDEDYPLEVSRLTQNLNQLLNSEEQRINRQKEVLGNLAHSLKTPIAVMNSLSYTDDNESEVKNQLGAMQTIIDYQLQSASTVGARRFSKAIEAKPVTQQIINSLKKLHSEKGLELSMNFDDSVVFYGDEGDWMEIAGNLLDNAFKWANTRVLLDVSNVPSSNKQSHRKSLKLVVEDDGAGIDHALKDSILKRGVRLDSQTPGHGLGLHIVKGIVDAYQGSLEIRDVTPTGTRFSVILN